MSAIETMTVPRRSGYNDKTPTPTQIQPHRRSLSTTAELAKMGRIISIWRDTCLEAKNRDRRIKRHCSEPNWKATVGFHPPRQDLPITTISGHKKEEDKEVVHEVHVDILEFDQDEAVLALQDPQFVTPEDDHNKTPWFEQDYEELPWWEYPDENEEDEVTAMCKEIIGHGVDQQYAERVAATVFFFALKLANRATFTRLKRDRLKMAQLKMANSSVEFDDIEMSTVVDAGEAMQEEELQEQSECDEAVADIPGETKDTMDEDAVAQAVEQAIREVLGAPSAKKITTLNEELVTERQTEKMQDKIIKEERFELLKENQILNLQHDQHDDIRRLLNSSSNSNTMDSGNQDEETSHKRRSSITDDISALLSRPNPRKKWSAVDEGNMSFNSSGLFSTGWNRLNIHNSEMRRYKKNLRRRKTGRDRWWADDHTVMAGESGDDASSDGARSISSFHSTPAMLEYTRTKQSWFKNSTARRRGSMESKGDSYSASQQSLSAQLAQLPSQNKKKRKKKKKAGQLAMFMAKEELKPDQETNIFDIAEEMQQTCSHDADESNERSHDNAEEDDVHAEVDRAQNTEGTCRQDVPDKQCHSSTRDASEVQSQTSVHNVAEDELQTSSSSTNILLDLKLKSQSISLQQEEHEENSNSVKGVKEAIFSPALEDDLAPSIQDEHNNDVQEAQSADEIKIQHLQERRNYELAELKKSSQPVEKTVQLFGTNLSQGDESHKDSGQTTNVSLSKASTPVVDDREVASEIKQPVPDKSASSPSLGLNEIKEQARRASASSLGYSSMHQPNSVVVRKLLQIKKQDESSELEQKSPEKSKPHKQPFFTRRASFSEIQFAETVGSNSTSPIQRKENPEFRLVMLRHAAICSAAQCPTDPICSQMKALLKHTMACKHQSTTKPCHFLGCHESKSYVVNMHKSSESVAHRVTKEVRQSSIDKDKDDMSSVCSFASNNPCQKEEVGDEQKNIGAQKSSGDRNSNVYNDLLGQSEHLSVRGIAQARMKRRTSWTGSVELVEHQEKIKSRERARADEAKAEVFQRQRMSQIEAVQQQKSVAELRRRHEEVKARVEKARHEEEEAAETSRLRAERMEKENAEKKEQKNLIAQKQKQDGSRVVKAFTKPVKSAARTEDRIEEKVCLAKKPVRKKEDLTEEQLELRRRHEGIKARLEQQQGGDVRAEIAAIKQKKQQRRTSAVDDAGQPSSRLTPLEKTKASRRSSLPANTGRLCPKFPSNHERVPQSCSGRRTTRGVDDAAKTTDEFRDICRKLSEEQTRENAERLVQNEKSQRERDMEVLRSRIDRVEAERMKDISEHIEITQEFELESDRIKQKTGFIPALASTDIAKAILEKKNIGKTPEQREFERLKAAKLAKREKKRHKAFVGH